MADETPTDAPDAALPDEAFCAKCDKYMAQRFPQLGAMHTQYAASMGPANGAPVPGAPVPPVPGAPPVAPPAAPPPGPPEFPKKKEPEPMGATVLPEQYHQRLAALEARNAALEKRLRTEAYRQRLQPLAEKYGFDLEDQLSTCVDREPAAFEAYTTSLVKLLDAAAARAADPTFYSMPLPVDRTPPPSNDLSQRSPQQERARQHMRANPGMTYDQAVNATSQAR